MLYSKSPIVEALIDIKTEESPDLKFDALHAITESISALYPRTETRYLGQGMISFGAEAKATAEQKPLALMFFSSDNKQIFQARTDGITASRLAPYTGWDTLRDEARRLWDIYRNFARPNKFTRLAVRYINQFVLPSNRIEPEDYFQTFPELSRKLPTELRDMNSFWMRLSIPQLDLGATLLINEAVTLASGPDTIPIVLDLDLFAENLAITDEKAMWSKLEELHARQGLYFEASITDKTRELIS
jgi:uncharacterized protein (TIGR04255 family)